MDDPLLRTKWMNVKKALSEETEVVKQLEAERKAFKETPSGRRPYSPPISVKSSSSSSYLFQPLDEFPTSSSSSAPPPMDDPDVWRPPNRDAPSRRPTRSGQMASRKSSQDGVWARGATSRVGTTTSRGAKAGATSKVNSGARASTSGKKGSGSGSASGKSSKGDSVVSFNIFGQFGSFTFVYCCFCFKILEDCCDECNVLLHWLEGLFLF